jgi:peptidoglycan/xylan/chitin deacetylase (PgdA/CDA1 family)
MGKTDIIKMRARIGVKRIIKTGAAIVSTFKPHTDIGHGVVVLMYHRVNDFRNDELSVKPDQFRRQVRWLHDMGFKNMLIRDLESLVERNEPLPENRNVIFSFDDGYEDNFTTAFPILKEFGYTGMFYLTADIIGTEKMFELDKKESGQVEHNRIMNWEQATKLLSEGMEIGSHTSSHAILTTIPDDQARQELVGSKKEIESKLGVEISSFCYPGGFFNSSHEKMVNETGYRSACTADMGIWRGGNILRIPRVGVLASDSLFIFKTKVMGRMEWFKVFR